MQSSAQAQNWPRTTEKTFSAIMRMPPRHISSYVHFFINLDIITTDASAIEPYRIYRILEAGASLGLLERPEMRDTPLFSIKLCRQNLESPQIVRKNLAGRAQNTTGQSTVILSSGVGYQVFLG